MKPILFAAAALGLAACDDMAGMMPGMGAPDATRISTAEAAAPYFGRQLAAGNGAIVINADGTFTGAFGGQTVAGGWEFSDGYWCRTLTEGPPAAMANPNDCQVWEVAGQEVRFTTDRGAGNTTRYVLG